MLELYCSPLLNALPIFADYTHSSTLPNPTSSVNSHLYMQVLIDLSSLKFSQHQCNAPGHLGCNDASPHMVHYYFLSESAQKSCLILLNAHL